MTPDEVRAYEAELRALSADEFAARWWDAAERFKGCTGADDVREWREEMDVLNRVEAERGDPEPAPLRPREEGAPHAAP